MPSIQFSHAFGSEIGNDSFSGITLIGTQSGTRVLASDANTGLAYYFSVSGSASTLLDTVEGPLGPAVCRHLNVDGVDILFTIPSDDSAVRLNVLGADGGIGPTTLLSGSENAGFQHIDVIGPASGQVFVATHQDRASLSSFSISGSGEVEILYTTSGPSSGGALSAIATATINGQAVALVTSAFENSITSYLVSDEGALTQADTRGAIDGLGINGPTDIQTVTLAGETYAILVSTETSSLSVFRLDDAGQMTLTDHVNDTRYSRFDRSQTVEVLNVDGTVFVVAGGVDGGITLFVLLPDGTLQDVTTFAPSLLGQLGEVSEIDFVADGDQLTMVAHDGDSASFSVLTYDLSNLGNILHAGENTDTVRGTAFDDVLLDGAGSQTMTGDSGSDIFALTADGDEDTVSDFEVGVDSLDLTRWGRIYSLDDLDFTPLSDGIRITFGEESLRVISHNGQPLEASDFSTSDVFTISRSSPDAHVGDNTGPIEGIIFGTEGNDLLEGSLGDDEIRAGGGNDVILVSSGLDQIDGGSGIDELSFYYSSVGASLDLQDSTDLIQSIENINGSGFDDHFSGTSGANQIIGWAGQDVIYGRAGDDVLAGGDGDDILNGGLGADTLAGGSGEDTADYDLATSGVRVDPRHLHLNLGEAMGDRYISIENFSGGVFADNLRGTTGSNVIHGHDGNDWLFGRWGNDTLYGGDGNDVLMGGAAADAHFGGSGQDRADYRESAVGVRVDLMTPSVSTGIAFGDTFDSIEDLAGGYASDNLRGDHGANTIIGRSGNDVIFGRNGADTLIGGDDDDTVYGGLGADTFVFSSGLDRYMDFNPFQGDTLEIDAGLLNGGTLADFGEIEGSSAVFDFGGGDVLELVNFSDLGVSYELIN